MDGSTAKKIETPKFKLEWKSELFNNNYQPMKLEDKIGQFHTNKAHFDIFNTAFPIDRIAYGITQVGETANKYTSGFISIDKFIELYKSIDEIINYDKRYKSNKDPAFNNNININGYFTYYGKRVDKENNEVYSRIFKIMPAKKENCIMIVIYHAQGIEDDKGRIKPVGEKEPFYIPVDYREFRGQLEKVMLHYSTYLGTIYGGMNKKSWRK